jgi:prepilin-type N-terminal cleavage/methylation domain-containing protein
MSGRMSSRTNQAGMTLVEILIAITILASAVLALMPLFAGAVKTAAAANQLSNANTLAREKLEELAGYPRGDQRVTVPNGANAAVPTGVTSTGSGSVVAVNAFCNNDLPSWYNPSTGAVSFAASSPGDGWYVYPYTRTYTVEQYAADLTTRVTSPATYVVTLLTVTVTPTEGPLPGLRRTTQSFYLRSPNV